MRRGSLFVLTGPSGTGKGTVLNRLFGTLEGLFYSVSVTTREPRAGEVDGRHYHFIARQEMQELIDSDGLLESAEYVGNYYGTPVRPVEEALANGLDVILEIEVQGAVKVRRRRPDTAMIFLIPPSFEELEKRLRVRMTETDEKIAHRLAVARNECKSFDAFDYVVINDVVDDAVDRIRGIILSHRCRAEHYTEFFNGINQSQIRI